jgi:hypothetical protein
MRLLVGYATEYEDRCSIGRYLKERYILRMLLCWILMRW